MNMQSRRAPKPVSRAVRGSITETTAATPCSHRNRLPPPPPTAEPEAGGSARDPAPRPCTPASCLQLGGKLRAFQPACGTHSPNRKEPVEREMWSDNRCSRKRGKKLLLKWQ